MDKKTASENLNVSELASQEVIETAFLKQVQEIGNQVRASKDPVHQQALKDQLKKAILAKKALLPNAAIVPDNVKRKVGALKSQKSNRSAPRAAQSLPGQSGSDHDQNNQNNQNNQHSSDKQHEHESAGDDSGSIDSHRDVTEIVDLETQGELDGVDLNEQVLDDENWDDVEWVEGEWVAEDEAIPAEAHRAKRSQVGSGAKDRQDLSDEVDLGPIQRFRDARAKLSAQDLLTQAGDILRGTGSATVQAVQRFKVPSIQFLKAHLRSLAIAASLFFVVVFVGFAAINGQYDSASAIKPERRLNATVSVDPVQTRLLKVIEEINQQIEAISEFQQTLIERQKGLTAKEPAAAHDKEKRIVEEMVTRVISTILGEQLEQDRWHLLEAGKTEFNEGNFAVAQIKLRDAKLAYQEAWGLLQQLEETVASRVEALLARERYTDGMAASGLDLNVFSQDIEHDWSRAENLYLELQLSESRSLYVSVAESFNRSLVQVKELITLVNRIKTVERAWLALKWADDIKESAHAKEITQLLDELDAATESGNVQVALEFARLLDAKFPGHLKAREAANFAREKAENVQLEYDSYRSLPTYRQLPNAVQAYALGIKMFQGGAWKRAVDEFALAHELYSKELSKVTLLRGAQLEGSRMALRSSRFEKQATRVIPVMIKIKGGRFKMGDLSESGDSSEYPVREVRVKSFYISKFEVTFAQYDAFAEATGRDKPADNGWGRGSRPVVNVTWEDAVAYTKWLARRTGKPYRLPSEAEWEYAARAGTTTSYPWGEKLKNKMATCNACGNPWDGHAASPVGSFSANAWGLFDMHGNVSEWVLDCWNGNYKEAVNDGSAQRIGYCARRIVRGGGWDDNPWLLRSSSRYASNKLEKVNFRGFRVAFRL